METIIVTDYLENQIKSYYEMARKDRRRVKKNKFDPTKGKKTVYIPELRLTVYYDPKKETAEQVRERKLRGHRGR